MNANLLTSIIGGCLFAAIATFANSPFLTGSAFIIIPIFCVLGRQYFAECVRSWRVNGLIMGAENVARLPSHEWSRAFVGTLLPAAFRFIAYVAAMLFFGGIFMGEIAGILLACGTGIIFLVVVIGSTKTAAGASLCRARVEPAATGRFLYDPLPNQIILLLG